MTKRNTRKNGNEPYVHQLANGDYVMVRGVSPMLIDQIQASVLDPEIPSIVDTDGSVIQNPNDPAYHRALAEAETLRNRRSLHAVISFGLTLCNKDGETIDAPDDGWEYRLKRVGIDWKERIEAITGTLEGDEEIKIAKREAYTLLIALSFPDMELVTDLMGGPELAQAQAEEMFQSSA